jgi:citrate lyase subunit beta/citryl-CoA lyase
MKPHQLKTDMKKFVRRSSLIFPINVERFLEKAYLRGADCIIMDLEDSVPINEKEAARELVKNSIPLVGKGGGDVSVRVNQPIDQAVKDLEASIWPGLTCVHLPKIENIDEVLKREKLISDLETRRKIPLGTVQLAIAVESALGIIRAYEIASSSSRIVTLSVGSEDLTQQIGVQTSIEGYELWYARSKIIIDANAAGVQPLGLVGVDPFAWREPEKIRDAAEKSRNLGFKGALSVHPVPIPYLNEGFSVPEQEASFMKRALEVFEDGLKKGIASVNLDGRMIDIASAERCKKIMHRVNAISELETRKKEALKNPDSLEEKLRERIVLADRFA